MSNYDTSWVAAEIIETALVVGLRITICIKKPGAVRLISLGCTY